MSVAAPDGATVNNTSPIDGALTGTVPAAAKQGVDRAVENAVAGQREWAAVPPYRRRIEICDRFRELVAAKRRDIAEMMVREGGKAIGDAPGEADIPGYIFRVFGEGARDTPAEVPHAFPPDRWEEAFALAEARRGVKIILHPNE